MTRPALARRLSAHVRARLDRLRGLDFHTAVEPEAVGLDASRVSRSTPSGDHYLAAVLETVRPTPHDRILDVGCGKGSAMRVMLEFPFGRVAGIELSPEIARIATLNFHRLRASRALVHIGDAAFFNGYDEFNMVYFYNPFPSQVMAMVLERITSAWRSRAEECLIVYNNPVCHELVAALGYEAVGDYPDEWGNGIRVYSTFGRVASRVTQQRQAPTQA